MATAPPIACPVCAALLLPTAVTTHVRWHASTQTLDGWSARDVERFIADNAAAAVQLADAVPRIDDTAKLPPYRETVLRRPPVPAVRELKGAELLRALADAMDDDEDLADDAGAVELLADAGGCFALSTSTYDRPCLWPDTTPCLAYGVEGCGMKAQES